MNKLNKENLTKCPLCKSELYDFSLMGLITTNSCYCPKCDIVRWGMMSIPFLCSECHSRSFYDKDGKHICWFCGNDNIVGMSYKEAEEKGLFETEGFKISGKFITRKNSGCKHEHTSNKRHNETVFEFTCNDCENKQYVKIPKWMQEEKKIGDHI